MAPTVQQFVERLHEVETDLEHEVEKRRRRLHHRVSRGRLWFDQELRAQHRRLRQSIPDYIREADLLSLLTAPIIYSLLVPFLALDLWVTVYQRVCFPIYGVARVPRRRYFAIDRHKLAYLNGIEKVNCTFCSYANGLIAYVREVAARTEQYWCPIKHARTIPTPHSRYQRFADYGDAHHYRKELPTLRRGLRGTSESWVSVPLRRYFEPAGLWSLAYRDADRPLMGPGSIEPMRT